MVKESLAILLVVVILLIGCIPGCNLIDTTKDQFQVYKNYKEVRELYTEIKPILIRQQKTNVVWTDKEWAAITEAMDSTDKLIESFKTMLDMDTEAIPPIVLERIWDKIQDRYLFACETVLSTALKHSKDINGEQKEVFVKRMSELDNKFMKAINIINLTLDDDSTSTDVIEVLNTSLGVIKMSLSSWKILQEFLD
ncbi:MAG: hypothetical protein GY710_25745 [Desulfobacteraceae bacterium]|nr:hypothetical protein [Desulfobacteraceae bacterium]